MVFGGRGGGAHLSPLRYDVIIGQQLLSIRHRLNDEKIVGVHQQIKVNIDHLSRSILFPLVVFLWSVICY